MIVPIVLTLVVVLAIALVIAVARDPGPTPTDVGIGYTRALAAGDFDAVYRLTDPELLRDRNRADWVRAERARPRLALDPTAVRALGTRRSGPSARVELTVDDAGRRAVVDLVLRQRQWVVEQFALVPGAAARSS